MDRDAVELSNLHRQIAHREEGVGAHKADSAGQACRALNSSIQARVLVAMWRACKPGVLLDHCRV